MPTCAEDPFQVGDTLLVLNDLSMLGQMGFYAYRVRGGDTWESIVSKVPSWEKSGLVYYFSRKGRYLVKTFNIDNLDVFPIPIHKGDVLVFGNTVIQKSPEAADELVRATFYLPAEMVYGKKDIPIIPISLGGLVPLLLTLPKGKRDR